MANHNSRILGWAQQCCDVVLALFLSRTAHLVETVRTVSVGCSSVSSITPLDNNYGH